MGRFLDFGVALAVLSGASSFAADWSQWRGPARNGVVVDFEAPEVWPESLTLEWKVPIGDGLSSPVVVGDRIFVQSREEASEVLAARDRGTGDVVWSHTVGVSFEFTDPSTTRVGMGPRSTPTVAGDRIFMMTIDGQLIAVSTEDGKELWKQRGEGSYERPYPKHGHALSPLVVDDLVIAHFGDDADGELNAYDLETGTLVWSVRGEAPSYASPIVAELSSFRHVIVLAARSLIGVTVDAGRVLWRTEFFTGSSNATTPAVFDDVVIVSGFQKGPNAFRVTRSGEAFRVELAWSRDRLRNWINDYVLDGSTLLGFSETRRGQLVALDAADGDMLWTTEGNLGGSARVLRFGTHLLVTLTNGDARIFAVSDGAASEVARYQVADGDLLSVPAVSGRHILVRSRSTLALWSVKADGT